MKLHRFIIKGCDLSTRGFRIENGELFNQIKNVLKLKAGERIIVSDGSGNEAEVEIRNIFKKYIEGDVLRTFENKNELEVSILLYCALLKRENFELVVQKATEVGVSEIIPCITQRTVKLGLNEERLVKIIKEAAEQSERGMLPALRAPIAFHEALKDSTSKQSTFLFDKGGKRFHEMKMSASERVGIFIGPEGGWTEEELSLAKTHGAELLSLSASTLRAETAAIVASYLAAHELKK